MIVIEISLLYNFKFVLRKKVGSYRQERNGHVEQLVLQEADKYTATVATKRNPPSL